MSLFFSRFSFIQARAVSQKLGRKLHDVSLDLHEPLNTLEGRELTFPEDWSGADRREMALAGFYYGDTGPSQGAFHSY